MSEQMQDFSRRDLLRVSLTTLGVSVVSAEAAQHVHHAVAEVKKTGPYTAKFFNAHEYQTLSKLADLIIPADEHSQGALAGGAPEFIDFLCSQSPELAAIYTGGLAWLDHEMNKRYEATFLAAKPEQQTAMLDLIAYRKNSSAELAPGVQFFNWARNMTVDAFYTSKAGMDDLGYMGNSAMSEFHVPAEAIDYAVKRSGLS